MLSKLQSVTLYGKDSLGDSVRQEGIIPKLTLNMVSECVLY
jgi:hypothetical protein